jgi:hypothetical protein
MHSCRVSRKSAAHLCSVLVCAIWLTDGAQPIMMAAANGITRAYNRCAHPRAEAFEVRAWRWLQADDTPICKVQTSLVISRQSWESVAAVLKCPGPTHEIGISCETCRRNHKSGWIACYFWELIPKVTRGTKKTPNRFTAVRGFRRAIASLVRASSDQPSWLADSVALQYAWSSSIRCRFSHIPCTRAHSNETYGRWRRAARCRHR